MNNYEKEEISRLPEKYRPVGAWTYFGYTILFTLPIIGFIILIVKALSDSNINIRSFARSYFCAIILALILTGVLMALGLGGTIAAALAGGLTA